MANSKSQKVKHRMGKFKQSIIQKVKTCKGKFKQSNK